MKKREGSLDLQSRLMFVLVIANLMSFLEEYMLKLAVVYHWKSQGVIEVCIWKNCPVCLSSQK